MTILRNFIAIIMGIGVGGALNMFIVTNAGSIIPLPEGVNPADMESLKENLHLFKFKHFIMPFLAHALGTFAGAFIAALIAANYKIRFAITIGIFFLVGGIINLVTLPSPFWFAIIDILFAYIPMAWLGWKLAVSLRGLVKSK